jgi:hypothetical protein
MVFEVSADVLLGVSGGGEVRELGSGVAFLVSRAGGSGLSSSSSASENSDLLPVLVP